MKYILRSCYIENAHVELIDVNRFNLLKCSRKTLTAGFEIEEIFDNLISNYLEVETRCLELTAHRLVRRSVGYREGYENLAEINLVFINYLSTARAYVDKIERETSRCFEPPEAKSIKERVKSLLVEQFGTSFGYRFMEALRNHVQHSGSALHKLSQGSRKLNADIYEETLNESFLTPLCIKSRLVERGAFKLKVLDECPDEVNLLECARMHVHGLSRVHRAVRDITLRPLAEARSQIKEGQALLDGKVTGSLNGTEAASLNQDDEPTETVPMLLHWEDVRAWLVQRNPGVRDGIQTFPSGRGEPLL